MICFSGCQITDKANPVRVTYLAITKRTMDVLHRAICNGQMATVRRLTDSGVDVDHVHGMQGTALSNAIASNQSAIAEYLIENMCDVNAPDFDGEPPLLLALRKGKFDIVKTLINHPFCDLDVVDPATKQTALCYAVSNGFVDVVTSLVENGRCDVGKTDGDNNTAMHLAVKCKNYDVLRILSRIPKLKEMWNKVELAPIHIAAQNGDIQTLEILYPCNRTRLEEPLFEKENVEAVIKNPTRDVNIKTRYTNDTALHIAVRERHHDFVACLLSRDININAQNNVGQTPLLVACSSGEMESVLLLLENKADPNKLGTFSNARNNSIPLFMLRDRHVSPLGIAAAFDNLPLAEALVHHGADINLRHERGKSPLYLALTLDSPETAMFLLLTAAELDVDIAAENYCGELLLHAVVKCSRMAYELTCLLISLGCSPAVKNRFQSLPLHEAIAHENVDVVRAILDEGGSMDEADRNGLTPLLLAAIVGSTEIGKTLLSHGADVNEVSRRGKPLLLKALEYEMVPFAKFLVRCGCRISSEKYLFDDFERDLPMVLLDDREAFDWMKCQARTPKSLVMCGLEKVRDIFRANPGTFRQMSTLPLPTLLKDRLFYRDVDIDDTE